MHPDVPAWRQSSQFGLPNTKMFDIYIGVRVNDVGLYFAIRHVLTVVEKRAPALCGAVITNHNNRHIRQLIEVEAFFPNRGYEAMLDKDFGNELVRAKRVVGSYPWNTESLSTPLNVAKTFVRKHGAYRKDVCVAVGAWGHVLEEGIETRGGGLRGCSHWAVSDKVQKKPSTAKPPSEPEV